MLAILAGVCFLLVVLNVAAPVNLAALGLTFLAFHLVFPYTPWGSRRPQ